MFHMGIGKALIDDFPHYRCRKIMVYHNITPPDMTGIMIQVWRPAVPGDIGR